MRISSHWSKCPAIQSAYLITCTRIPRLGKLGTSRWNKSNRMSRKKYRSLIRFPGSSRRTQIFRIVWSITRSVNYRNSCNRNRRKINKLKRVTDQPLTRALMPVKNSCLSASTYTYSQRGKAIKTRKTSTIRSQTISKADTWIRNQYSSMKREKLWYFIRFFVC